VVNLFPFQPPTNQIKDNDMRIMNENEPKYKHLGKRVVNKHTGTTGIVADAVKTSRTTWEITVKEDLLIGGRHSLHPWSSADFTRHNAIVPDDYKPQLPDDQARIAALLSKGTPKELPWGHVTEMRTAHVDHGSGLIAEDRISFACESGKAEMWIRLWGRYEPIKVTIPYGHKSRLELAKEAHAMLCEKTGFKAESAA
jgi:hypothetical protein